MVNLISTASFGENEPASTFYKELEKKNLDSRAIIMFSLAETTINHILNTLSLPSNNEKMRPNVIYRLQNKEECKVLQVSSKKYAEGSLHKSTRTVVWASRHPGHENLLIESIFHDTQKRQDVYESTILWLLGVQALADYVKASQSTVK